MPSVLGLLRFMDVQLEGVVVGSTLQGKLSNFTQPYIVVT
jgi:hypothetical protein